jgi:hypothetical protein
LTSGFQTLLCPLKYFLIDAVYELFFENGLSLAVFFFFFFFCFVLLPKLWDLASVDPKDAPLLYSAPPWLLNICWKTHLKFKLIYKIEL